MYEVSVVSLEGILEEIPGSKGAETWEKSIEAFMNGRWEKGWEMVQMFGIGHKQDAVLQKLVVIWKLRARQVKA